MIANDAEVAPATGVQIRPFWLQRSHWNAVADGVVLQLPASAVSV